MNPMVATMIQPLLSSLDIGHLLKVLSGADQPTPSERDTLQLLHRMLSSPVGGDVMWDKFSSFMREKQFDDLAMAYLSDGVKALGVETSVGEDLRSSKAAFADTLHAILNNDNVSLAAVVQCPKCDFVYGVTK